MNLDEAITHAEEAGIRLSSDCMKIIKIYKDNKLYKIF